MRVEGGGGTTIKVTVSKIETYSGIFFDLELPNLVLRKLYKDECQECSWGCRDEGQGQCYKK